MKHLYKSNIESIQYLRGMAALMVVLFHASREARDILGPSAFAWGEFGVDIFFVISGFVMTYSIAVSKTELTPLSFMKNRILRIAPMYWMLTALMATAILIKPDLFSSAKLTAAHLTQSLLFIPHFHPKIEGAVMPLLVPGWTLNYEMYFYLILSIFLIFTGLKRTFFSSLFLLSGFLLGLAFKGHGAIFQFLSNPIVFEFSLGMLIGEAYLRGHLLPEKSAKLTAAAAFLSILLASNLNFRLESAGLSSAILVYSLASFEFNFKSKVKSLLKSLGDSSYSLYLSHAFVIGIVSAAWNRLAGIPISSSYYTASIYMTLCAVLSCLAGAVIYRLVEIRIINFFKRRTDAKRLASRLSGA